VQGAQGLGKSSFFATLAGEPYFLDHMPPITDKDARTALRGPWIVEFAELAGMKHAEQEHTKAFLTTQRDRYRPSYGRYEIDSPRRCVFAGTTNEDQFLRDDTGARRFWCVTATKSVDLVALFAERDQIWAEAVADYRDGVPWHLSGDLEAQAREAAAARYVEDPWMPIAAEWVAGRPSFTAAEFAGARLDMSPRDIHRGVEKRLGSIFRELGFEHRRVRSGSGRREWRWVANSDGPGNEE
jgi:predicted P-loop ATPase